MHGHGRWLPWWQMPQRENIKLDKILIPSVSTSWIKLIKSLSLYLWACILYWAALFKAGLRYITQARVSAIFELRFESLKSISALILFVYKLMIGSSKKSTENYPRKCFWTQDKETWVNFNLGLSANQPSNNSALGSWTSGYMHMYTKRQLTYSTKRKQRHHYYVL